jgi:hypothetical protein
MENSTTTNLVRNILYTTQVLQTIYSVIFPLSRLTPLKSSIWMAENGAPRTGGTTPQTQKKANAQKNCNPSNFSEDEAKKIFSFPGVKRGDKRKEGNSPLISSKRVIDPVTGAVAF